jgi:simple sugar transport system ATP-binding protein/ribose transport system ATP-binding protein
LNIPFAEGPHDDVTAHVELIGISKAFEGTRAVDRVDLTVRRGSVHALVGENGAGKSTLGKIIAGAHVADEGEYLLEGARVRLGSPRDALQHGVTMIAQELSLVPTRDVLDNVYLGMEDRKGLLVDRKRMKSRFSELVSSTGLQVPPDALVGSLSVAQQQQVEILRAVAREARLVVMDEPTSRLSGAEAAALHELVRELASRGTTVVFISHFLDEILALADSVTVLRDGKVVKTGPASDESSDSLIVSMTGNRPADNFPVRSEVATDASEVLQVTALSRRDVFDDVTLTVRAGEIVGLAGLVGAGRSEVARAIFGADMPDSGRIYVSGREMRRTDIASMLAAGVAMIPESRKTQGLLLSRPVRENVSLRYLKRVSRLGVISRHREAAQTRSIADQVGVRRGSDEQPVASLSGGNQQKALFARWLMQRPTVLIADEPTSGVDVAAKRSIYELIVKLAADGVGVLLISSEVEELLGLAHRILVMRRGRIVRELSSADATERAVIEAAFGTEQTAA